MGTDNRDQKAKSNQGDKLHPNDKNPQKTHGQTQHDSGDRGDTDRKGSDPNRSGSGQR